jgi:peptidyl-prolyl cis-trans isomerase D
MISWIQRAFQQHFRVIFAVLLAGTIVSFIMTIGAAPGIGGPTRKTRTRPFFGLNLDSEEDQRRIFGDANLSIVIQAGYNPYDQARLEQYALTRQASLALGNQLGIPAPTDAEITEYIKALPRFAGNTGQFDGHKYSDFRDSLKRSNVAEGDVSRVISDNIRIDRVNKLLGGPGFVLPSEVKMQVSLMDTAWSLGIASIEYSSFQPTITPNEAEIAKYFTDNKAHYVVPPQVELSYVEFPLTSYLAKVNVTEPEVRAFFDSNPSRFQKPAMPQPGKPIAAPAAADYNQVHAEVEAAVRLDKAKRLAAKDASDFAVALYDRKATANSNELKDFISQRGLSLKSLPAFSENEPPALIGNDPQVVEEAFKLDKERYFSDALPTETGSIVLFWNAEIASHDSTLAEAHAKVAADYVEQQRRQRFADLGKTVREQLSAHLKSGEAFDKAVAAVATANKVKIDANVHPTFTLQQPPRDLDQSYEAVLTHLNKGDISNFVDKGEKGVLVVALDKKTPPMDDTSSPQFQQMRQNLQRGTAATNRNEYVSMLVQGELAKSTDTDN